MTRDLRDRVTVLCMLTYPLILLSKPVNPNFVRRQRYRIAIIFTKPNNTFAKPLNYSTWAYPSFLTLNPAPSDRDLPAQFRSGFPLQSFFSIILPNAKKKDFHCNPLRGIPFLQNRQQICNPSIFPSSKLQTPKLTTLT